MPNFIKIRPAVGGFKHTDGQDLHYNQKFWEELIAYFPWYDTGHIENDASNNSPIVACVFVTVVKFLPSRCLATMGKDTDTRTWSHKPILFPQIRNVG
jgi:hypothetical protein